MDIAGITFNGCGWERGRRHVATESTGQCSRFVGIASEGAWLEVDIRVGTVYVVGR